MVSRRRCCASTVRRREEFGDFVLQIVTCVKKSIKSWELNSFRVDTEVRNRSWHCTGNKQREPVKAVIRKSFRLKAQGTVKRNRRKEKSQGQMNNVDKAITKTEQWFDLFN